MKEVNRFSIRYDGKMVRTTVLQDDGGFYHIDEQVYTDPDKINTITGQPTPLTDRKDIHGRMDANDLNRWLMTALYQQVYSHASSREKNWMIE